MNININYNPSEVAQRVIRNADAIVSRSNRRKVPPKIVPEPQIRPEMENISDFKYRFEELLKKSGRRYKEKSVHTIRERLMAGFVKDVDYIRLNPVNRKMLEAQNIVYGMSNVKYMFSDSALRKVKRDTERLQK